MFFYSMHMQKSTCENRTSTSQVVAPLYVQVLKLAAAKVGPGPVYQRLWPAEPLQPPWDSLLEGEPLSMFSVWLSEPGCPAR